MKSDRELLEAAARAMDLWPSPEPFEHVLAHWNPLTDDGDALRLAVKLNFTCRFYFGNACAQATTPNMPSAYEEVQNSTDPMAGARLAIVRAAAAMAG